MRKFYSAAVLLALMATAVNGQEPEDTVKPKEVCEKNAEQCLSAPTSFKCSMMFKNLTNAGSPLTVLDIIPDLINHGPNPKVKEELDKKEINFKAFKIADVCPGPSVDESPAGKTERLKQFKAAEKRANARCYAFLNEYSTEPLDSCDTGLIEDENSDAETVGDHLCQRAYRLSNPNPDKEFWFTSLLEIGAYVSYCGSSWQEVQTGGKQLVIQQKLCCVRRCRPKAECAEGRGKVSVKYQRCDGSPNFNKKCDRNTVAA